MLSLLTSFAQSYNYSYSVNSTSSSTTSGGVSAVIVVIYLAVIVFLLACMWRVFTKAKQPGWAAIIPFYNTYVLLKIVGRPWWWLLLILVPVVNIVVLVMVWNDLSKSFGKGVGTTILLILFPYIGLPMLAFGSAQYGGPVASAMVEDPGVPSTTAAAPSAETSVAPASDTASAAPTGGQLAAAPGASVSPTPPAPEAAPAPQAPAQPQPAQPDQGDQSGTPPSAPQS